jgi:DNA-binding NtrC family response regulator
MNIRVVWFDASEGGRTLPEAQGAPELYVHEVKSDSELKFHLREMACDAVVLCVASLEAAVSYIDGIRAANRQTPIVVCCAEGTPAQIVRVTKLGAHHTFVGEVDLRSIAQVLSDVIDPTRFGSNDEKAEPWRRFMIGESPVMQRVSDLIRLVAPRRSTVLITGQTGTGKEVVARAIHAASDRARQPFVAVNCSAIPENLIESELFGYVKGAFTGAAQSRAGLFEQADGGTIFLDEVGELPLELQAKLLRVLQERELQRLGSSEVIKLNVRIVAATNADLEAAVAVRKFREDLYYRLSVVPVRLPSLRERSADIAVLTRHFVDKVCDSEGIPRKRISAEIIRKLSSRNWPGNVRQLEHAVELAIVLSGDREELQAADFGEFKSASDEIASHGMIVPEAGLNFNETVSGIERRILNQALLRSGGNKARAAELLQIKRTTLLAKLKSLDCAEYGTATMSATA